MAQLNQVLLRGNLTRDPEKRFLPSGTSVVNFGLAVNRYRKAQDGSRQEETTFVDVEAWGPQAETISKYMIKGRPISGSWQGQRRRILLR